MSGLKSNLKIERATFFEIKKSYSGVFVPRGITMEQKSVFFQDLWETDACNFSFFLHEVTTACINELLRVKILFWKACSKMIQNIIFSSFIKWAQIEIF